MSTMYMNTGKLAAPKQYQLHFYKFMNSQSYTRAKELWET